jgi:thiol-disulfide isomerase/thioredoxin
MRYVPFISVYLMISFSGHTQDHIAPNAFKGTPLELVEAEGVIVPVYDFEGFRPYLESRDDTTYIINFWATWCKPCVEEMPHFLRLADELSDQNVRFLFVSLDFRRSLEKSVIPFMLARGMTRSVVLLSDPDANNWIEKVDPSWSGAIPATYIYQNDRKAFYENALSFEELESIVKSFLKP